MYALFGEINNYNYAGICTKTGGIVVDLFYI